MKLKLVTYNIFNGKHRDVVIKNILALAKEGVNIFCLQEVRNLGNGESIIDLLLQKLGVNWQAEKLLNDVTRPNDLGLCVIWDSLVVSLKKSDNLLLPKLTKVDLLEKTFRKINKNYHFPVQRSALRLDFECNGKPLRVTNIHLDVSGGKAHKTRQLGHLQSYLKAIPAYPNEIVCGDFNTLGWGLLAKKYKSKMAEFFGSDFKNVFPKQVRTGPLYQHLDHIFVKGLALVAAEVKRMRGSDHKPVVAEFEIK